MEKLVYESIDYFVIPNINEAKGDDDSHGPVGGAWKAVKTAIPRAFRRGRARIIMQKYKTKLIAKIDVVMGKYVKNIESLVQKSKNRIKYINKSKGTSEAKASQMEDVIDDVKDALTGILKTCRSSAEELIKVYAESLDKRLERPGTITGVEFFPEDKTNLLSEWKTIEGEINYYVETKLLDLLDNIKIAELTKLKAEMKDFIEQTKPFSYRFKGSDETSDPATITDKEEQKVLAHLTHAGVTLDVDIKINKPANFPDNKAGDKVVRIKIDNKTGQVGWKFYTTTMKSGASFTIPSTGNTSFYYFIRPKDASNEWLKRFGEMKSSSNI